MPYRDIDEKSKVNGFSLNTASGEAGSFVKVVSAELTKDPVAYVNSSYYGKTLGNATSQFPEVIHKVGLTSGTGDAGQVLGMLLNDVRTVDENGESLLFYPIKKTELQCVFSGEAVPIATEGIVDLFVPRALEGGVVPAINSAAVLGANGKVTGVAFSALSTEQRNAVVGKFIGTGFRESQQTTDSRAGAYARLKFSV
jgi:hypothetical protein